MVGLTPHTVGMNRAPSSDGWKKPDRTFVMHLTHPRSVSPRRRSRLQIVYDTMLAAREVCLAHSRDAASRERHPRPKASRSVSLCVALAPLTAPTVSATPEAPFRSDGCTPPVGHSVRPCAR